MLITRDGHIVKISLKKKTCTVYIIIEVKWIVKFLFSFVILYFTDQFNLFLNVNFSVTQFDPIKNNN